MSDQDSIFDNKPWRDDNAKPFVRIDNVSKKFGDVVAVDAVNLDIYQGELFCLLGGSGSGKSTLLRMLSGFESPTSGNLLIDGQSMLDVPSHLRPVNMMFQSYALFPHMTVAANIAYGLKRQGISRTDTAKEVERLLNLVQLDGMAKRKPNQLSGGQRQRVALARSLARKPKLLLLDEPLGALDKKLREETQFELMKIQEQTGVTFIVVTHDQEEAMTLATRIGVMHEGRIVQVGEPHELYEYPNSRLVADFIGSVNLFSGRVTEESDDYTRIDSPDLGGTINVGHGISGAPEQTVWYALRPEKIRLFRKGNAPKDVGNFIHGTVDEVAYMGNLSRYRIILDSGTVVRVTQPNLTRQSDHDIRWDQSVTLTWDDTAGVVLTQ